MAERTNLAASPTMQRALRESFADDPRIDDADQYLTYGDPDGWQGPQSRYEDDLWGCA
jgi:hypothetical protein